MNHRNHIRLLIGTLIMTVMSGECAVPLNVVVDVHPTSEFGYVTGHVTTGAQAPPSDQNFCWKRPGCDYAFFVVDESWLPSGRFAVTEDKNRWVGRMGESTTDYYSFSEWWAKVLVRDRPGVVKQYIAERPPRPCLVVAAIENNHMVNGGIISNCAKIVVRPPTCRVEPSDIQLHYTVIEGQDVPPTRGPDVYIRCDANTSVTIGTDTKEKIPLGGSSSTVAALDWGAGFGNPSRVTVSGGAAVRVPLRVRTTGVARLGAGVVHGSAVVELSYN